MRRGTQVVILLLFVLAFVLAYSLGKEDGHKHHQEADTSRDQVQRDRGQVTRPPPARPSPRIHHQKRSTSDSSAKDDEESGNPEQEASAPDAEALKCATALSPDCSFLAPSPEELGEMARCATIKSDFPPGLITDDASGFPLPKNAIEAAGLTAPEKAKILRATDGRDPVFMDSCGCSDKCAPRRRARLRASSRRRRVPRPGKGGELAYEGILRAC